ncbi:MAG: thioredoxin [Bacteroidales bacterium]|nr:thioredoxin [Bacteroidales bacterium]
MKTKHIISILIALCLSIQLLYAEGDAKSHIIHLTKETFLTKVMNYKSNPNEWKYLGDKPCLIDFYATWCGPCKRLSPVLEELANEYDGEIYIYKIDIDQERELAQVFQVSSVPTLLFCPLGENPQMAKGALPKETLCDIIEKVLLKK